MVLPWDRSLHFPRHVFSKPEYRRLSLLLLPYGHGHDHDHGRVPHGCVPDDHGVSLPDDDRGGVPPHGVHDDHDFRYKFRDRDDRGAPDDDHDARVRVPHGDHVCVPLLVRLLLLVLLRVPVRDHDLQYRFHDRDDAHGHHDAPPRGVCRDHGREIFPPSYRHHDGPYHDGHDRPCIYHVHGSAHEDPDPAAFSHLLRIP
jgi:hypothetical protein